MWNFETGDLIDEAIHNDEKNQRRPLPSDDAVFCTSFAPHGRMILSCSGGKTVKIWELAQDDSENGEKERIKFLRTLQVHTVRYLPY